MPRNTRVHISRAILFHLINFISRLFLNTDGGSFCVHKILGEISLKSQPNLVRILRTRGFADVLFNYRGRA
jgi:hypothetical protein